MRMLRVFFRLAVLSFMLSSVRAEEISGADIESAVAAVRTVQDLFKVSSKSHQSTDSTAIKFEKVPANWEPEKVVVYGSPTIQLWASNFRLATAYDYTSVKRIALEGTDPPQLSIESVVEKARGFLQRAGIEIPDSTILSTVSYDHSYRSCWEVRWTRCDRGYLWDDFDSTLLESVCVIFHEKWGLIGVGNNIVSPSPTKFEVRIERGEAISKASRCVSAVQRTPFYRETYPDGGVVDGLKSCELRIFAPNWLLDPARAIWSRKQAVTETRLCWVVRFSTRLGHAEEKSDARKTKGREPLRRGEVLIYIDSLSGEVVGANFS